MRMPTATQADEGLHGAEGEIPPRALPFPRQREDVRF